MIKTLFSYSKVTSVCILGNKKSISIVNHKKKNKGTQCLSATTKLIVLCEFQISSLNFFISVCSVFDGYIHFGIAIVVIFMNITTAFAFQPFVAWNIDFFTVGLVKNLG